MNTTTNIKNRPNIASTIRRKFIAIGGGEIGGPQSDGSGNYSAETNAIDTEILRLTGKKAASLLFIPTASSDAGGYYETVKTHFSKIGFASVDVLYLIDSTLTIKQIKDVILSHDAIYVGGGDTLKMMAIWRKLGVDLVLKQAAERGIVLSGISAGSICWFSQGVSDSKTLVGDTGTPLTVIGLGLIDAVHCPHYDTEPWRQSAVKNSMKNSSKVAICLDNGAAIEVIGDNYKIITSIPGAKAHKAYWKNDTFYIEEIIASDALKNVDELLRKYTYNTARRCQLY